MSSCYRVDRHKYSFLSLQSRESCSSEKGSSHQSLPDNSCANSGTVVCHGRNNITVKLTLSITLHGLDPWYSTYLFGDPNIHLHELDIPTVADVAAKGRGLRKENLLCIDMIRVLSCKRVLYFVTYNVIYPD